MKRLISIVFSMLMLCSVFSVSGIAASSDEVSSQPSVSAQSTESVPSTESSEPTESVPSTDPSEPTDSTPSTESTQSTEPISTTEPSSTTIPGQIPDNPATSGKCGKTSTWNYDSETKTLTISGTGEMYNFTYHSVPWYPFAESIEKLDIADGITEIGYYSFFRCKSLTEVTIPDSVTAIGSSAFMDCSGLTSVTMSKNVTKIESLAFSGCENLKNLYISDLENWCRIPFGFYDSVPLNNGGNLYLNNELVTDLVIPDSITSINDYAFLGATNIKSVTIHDGVTSIGSYAFLNCTEIESVTIPESVITIGEYAFGYEYYDRNYVKENDFIICGGENTEAQAYATQNEFTFKINCKVHTEVIDEAVDPTCIKTGLTEGKHCAVCLEVLVAQEEIPATGQHDMITVTAKDATCEENGHGKYTYCKVCQTPPASATPPLGHDFCKSEITKEPICTENGEKTFYCSRCDKTETEKIPSTGHTTKKVGKKSATYFTKGHTGNKVCKTCGKIISKGKVTAILKLKTPTVKYTAGKKTLKIKYTKVKDASGFVVKYKIGKKSFTKTFSTKKSATKTIKKLAKGTYKVQIRAFVKRGTKKAYSNWTKAKNIKVK